MAAGLDPDADDICFTTEPFFGFMAEVGIEAKDTIDFIDKAVEFSNNRLMGTLAAMVLWDSKKQKDKSIVSAVKRAVTDLRYGTIGINYHPAASWASGVTPWGPYPNDNICDIQSGSGFVHNTLMFGQVQKVVFQAPFRSRPKPAWFFSKGTNAEKVFKELFYLEAALSLRKIPAVLWNAVFP